VPNFPKNVDPSTSEDAVDNLRHRITQSAEIASPVVIDLLAGLTVLFVVFLRQTSKPVTPREKWSRPPNIWRMK
jgi:hypothetical protein